LKKEVKVNFEVFKELLIIREENEQLKENLLSNLESLKIF